MYFSSRANHKYSVVQHKKQLKTKLNMTPPAKPYGDIINHPHPISQRRRRMSMDKRASQFAPFAALSGYEDAIDEVTHAYAVADPHRMVNLMF